MMSVWVALPVLACVLGLPVGYYAYRHPRRAAWTALLALTGISLLALAERIHWTLGLLAHFRAQYALTALVLLPGAYPLQRRRGWFLGLALAVAIGNASSLKPYLFPPPPSAPPRAPSVSVLLWNTWRKNEDHARVNRLLRTVDADVALLQETTEAVRARLEDLDDIYRLFTAGDNAVLTRPILHVPVHVVQVDGLHGLHLEITVGASTVDLLAVHLSAPVSGDAAAARTRQFAALTGWIQRRTAPVVLMGDLNATPWSHELVDLRVACHLEDSLEGCGLQPTWPFHNLLTSALRIPLDHCFHTPEVVAFDRRVGEPEGANHRPLFVRLAWRPGRRHPLESSSHPLRGHECLVALRLRPTHGLDLLFLDPVP